MVTSKKFSWMSMKLLSICTTQHTIQLSKLGDSREGTSVLDWAPQLPSAYRFTVLRTTMGEVFKKLKSSGFCTSFKRSLFHNGGKCSTGVIFFCSFQVPAMTSNTPSLFWCCCSSWLPSTFSPTPKCT